LISGSCLIAGTVKDSVLSPGVRIAAGASVVDSILWDDVVVEAGARLEGVVSDKRCHFGAGARVGEGDAAPSEEVPNSLTCGATIVGMDVRVPPEARIGRNCLIHPEVSAEALSKPISSGRSVYRSGSGGGRA
jgi:glucose-1-phosphate adenylyltransferase